MSSLPVIGSSIKAVLFDHDDTLVQTIGPKWDEHKFIAKTYYNKDITDDDIRKYWGMPLTQVCCMLYETDDADQAIEYNMRHHESFPKILFPYTHETLQKLHEAGKKIGIITATHRYSVEYDLANHEFDMSVIDYVQGEGDTEFHKPDPRVFDPAKEWLATQDIELSEVVYIADGLHDMKAAFGAGFSFIGVATGLVSIEDFQKAGAVAIPNLGELQIK
jgi:phosphoglycolate phosphatase-like HAD superfamily hydrolase